MSRLHTVAILSAYGVDGLNNGLVKCSGMPLIERCVRMLNGCHLVDKTVVFSDNENVCNLMERLKIPVMFSETTVADALYAKQLAKKIPKWQYNLLEILRASQIRQRNCVDSNCLRVLSWLAVNATTYVPDLVVHVSWRFPFLLAEDVDHALSQLLNSGLSSLFTIKDPGRSAGSSYTDAEVLEATWAGDLLEHRRVRNGKVFMHVPPKRCLVKMTSMKDIEEAERKLR